MKGDAVLNKQLKRNPKGVMQVGVGSKHIAKPTQSYLVNPDVIINMSYDESITFMYDW